MKLKKTDCKVRIQPKIKARENIQPIKIKKKLKKIYKGDLT